MESCVQHYNRRFCKTALNVMEPIHFFLSIFFFFFFFFVVGVVFFF